MSKKDRPATKPRARVRVAEPAWNASVEGVLKQALLLHGEHRYTDVVVIGVRRTTSDGVTPIDTLTFTTDKFRIAGIVRWALDTLLHR
jgi:hypothetical protein